MSVRVKNGRSFNGVGVGAVIHPLLVAVCLALTMQGFSAAKPNIVLIVADDLGYGDVGVYGGKEVPTPHIDRIAQKGVRFTAGYVTQPVCAPSRAGLMSGMYSQRFGFENNSGPEKVAPANFGLPEEIPTLAEKLKEAGYATGLVGKWHLGFKEGMRPNDRGFDYFYGFIGGSRSYFPEKSQNNAPIVRNGEVVKDEKEYLTDAFAREAIQFISGRSINTSKTLEEGLSSGTKVGSESQPFFLYLAFNAVHLPMEKNLHYEERFKHIKDPKRRTFAGMLSAMDDAIGRVMVQLAELGQEENTLVFFLSDNGGPTPYTTSSNSPLRGTKGEVYEGGIRVPFMMQWPGQIRGNRTFTNQVMAFDCHATALAAASLPNEKLDGVNLLPYLMNQNPDLPHPYLCWRFGDRKAVRMGDWKLVKLSEDSPAQLYKVSEDVGEQHDLAAGEPGKVKDLSDKLAAWEKEMKPPAWQSGEGKE